ncbi:MAG TPA: hypothetical protein PLV68_04220, partial [Ilumatobacteraceae bacterium]|nr:hypothetical protein [Ilumatobacteraceae bacterium]
EESRPRTVATRFVPSGVKTFLVMTVSVNKPDSPADNVRSVAVVPPPETTSGFAPSEDDRTQPGVPLAWLQLVCTVTTGVSHDSPATPLHEYVTVYVVAFPARTGVIPGPMDTVKVPPAAATGEELPTRTTRVATNMTADMTANMTVVAAVAPWRPPRRRIVATIDERIAKYELITKESFCPPVCVGDAVSRERLPGDLTHEHRDDDANRAKPSMSGDHGRSRARPPGSLRTWPGNSCTRSG